jgi:hypothetical protein
LQKPAFAFLGGAVLSGCATASVDSALIVREHKFDASTTRGVGHVGVESSVGAKIHAIFPALRPGEPQPS